MGSRKSSPASSARRATATLFSHVACQRSGEVVIASAPSQFVEKRASLNESVASIGRAGRGRGAEVMREGERPLEPLGLGLDLHERPFGGPGIRECGDPLPAETL